MIGSQNPGARKVTVAAVRACVSGISGPENLILDLGEYLGGTSFRYIVITLFDGQPANATELHQTALQRGLDAKLIYAPGDYNPSVVWKLRRVLRAERVDIIHAYSEKAEIASYLASRGLGCRLVASYYGRVSVGSFRHALHQSTSLLTLRLFDRVLANSLAQREDLLRFGHSSSKVDVVPSFVDVADFPPLSSSEVAEVRRELGLAPEARVVATVARLDPEKGHTLFVDALADLSPRWPDLVWLVVGDGRLMPEIRAKVDSLGLSRHVLFVGHRTDLRRVVGACDFVVSPSLREGMSVALLSVMALCKPIVGTAVGGGSEIIRTNETGILVEPGDATALAAGVDRLLADPELTARLGANSRALIESTYASNIVCAQITRSYRELLRGGTYLGAARS